MLDVSESEESLAPPIDAGGERGVVRGPDFICIGMEKAGSGWLYDQLQAHPDFWMPPVKGLHYLDDPRPQMKNAKRQLDRLQKRRGGARAKRRPSDDRNEAFLHDVIACSGQPRDLERYISFFRCKGNQLSGDVTAPYFMLHEEMIAEIACHLPDVSILLLVRDPVARVWSHLSMAHREGKFDERLLENPKAFRGFLENSNSVRRRSFPSKAVAAWRKSAPAIRFKHFFFDDIANDPANARRKILCYLGADPEKTSGELAPSHNRKAKAAKLPMNAEIKQVLVEHFAEELRACAAVFGGHAQVWKANYGI